MERKVSLFQCTIFWKAMWWLCNMCTFYKRFSRPLAFSSWTKGGGVQSATVPKKLLQFQLISGCYHSAGHLYNSLEELMQSKWGEFPVKGGGTEDSRHAQIPAPSHRGAQRRSCSHLFHILSLNATLHPGMPQGHRRILTAWVMGQLITYWAQSWSLMMLSNKSAF